VWRRVTGHLTASLLTQHVNKQVMNWIIIIIIIISPSPPPVIITDFFSSPTVWRRVTGHLAVDPAR
jgi:hypothetical protein